MARTGDAPLAFMHCNGYKKEKNCASFDIKGKITYENRYDIRNWRDRPHPEQQQQQQLYPTISYDNSQMFSQFVAVLNSQNKFNKDGMINAIPVIGYHDIIATYPDLSYTNQSSDTTLNLFEEEMKYLHDNGFRVITFSDLGYDENSNSLFIKTT